jgi:hypothetical protein
LAREGRLIHERIDREPLTTPTLSVGHVEYIKDTIISALRDVFSRDPDFAYLRAPDGVLPDFDNPNLGIVITDVFGYEVEFLPAMTIRVNSGTVKDVSFNQNQFTYDYQHDENGKPVKDPIGRPIPVYQEFAGIYETNATINIHTWDPLAREKLVTRAAILFKHVLRDQLYADFGLFVQNVAIGGETESPYNNDHIYSQSVSIDILTGWTNRIPVGPPVECINFQIIGDAVSPSKPGTVVPSKKDLEDSPRVDFLIEMHMIPELVLEDALVWSPSLSTFIITQDWVEILQRGGITIEESIIQINTGSSLRQGLLESTIALRMKANTARANKKQGMQSGSPDVGFAYKMRDGTRILVDDTVILPNNVRVAVDQKVTLISGTVIEPDNEILISSNIDLDFGTDPFTATSFTDLTAYNFFLILLFVDSPARQSIMGLNKLIDDFANFIAVPAQVTVLENIRSEINALSEHRFLMGKVVNFDRLRF